jgi:hypothetical protein
MNMNVLKVQDGYMRVASYGCRQGVAERKNGQTNNKMTSLSDQIDRLSQCACSIKDTTLGALKNNNPFTTAVLTTQLGDLIRDVDPSELGLFNLVPSSDPEIKRVEFTGPTPLRKPTRRDDKPPEIDPEVYAQAALKCIDQ